MGARSASWIIFRLLYSSLYTILFILLVLLLAVTPGDHIYQTVSNSKFGNVFVVGGTYVVTAIIAFFIYASRLYTNRTALLAIPKSYLPIEEGELGKKVRKMIVKNRQRSAMIAWESRPRDLRSQLAAEEELYEKNEAHYESKAKRRRSKTHEGILSIDPRYPPWGDIVHRGWSSPTSPEVPDLHFETVLAELPNLIEAKAVSTAPPDPAFDFLASAPDQTALQPPPDPQAVALLQRPPYMGVREYLNHLSSLRLVGSEAVFEMFVNRYENARFSTVPLTEPQFLDLMAAFSDLLAGMQSPDWDSLEHTGDMGSSKASMASTSGASQMSILHHRPAAKQSSSSLDSDRSVVRH